MPSDRAGRRALVFGGSGLVGRALVRALLASPGVELVVAPARRADAPIPGDPRVRAPVVAFGRLAAWSEDLTADQVFLTLGTTRRKAGSREAFRRVDFDAVLEAARVAREAGARDAFLVSSLGADPRSRSFYLRVKGEVERALSTLPFESVHVFRPSILTGPRIENRPAEKAGIVLAGLLAPFLVGPARRYRPVPAEVVARAMVRASERPGDGRFVHESEEIVRLGG